MKILHLSTHDLDGGAAIAASRLHSALRAAGEDSTMLVADKMGGDPHTQALHNRFSCSLRQNLARLPLKFEGAGGSISWRSLGWLPNPKLARAIKAHRADLVHLHWVQNGFFPISMLSKLRVPIVWTFHDMWPVCGEYHYEYEEHVRHTGAYTRSNRPAGHGGLDFDRRVWRRKRKLYNRVPMTAAVPSRWMADRAKESDLWRGLPVEVIPNGLDTKVFKRADQAVVREMFNLPTDKTLIVFGAMFAGSDPRKGYRELKAALELLELPKESTELVVFGMSEPDGGSESMPYPTRWMGVLRDEFTLSALYSAADVMVVPSLQESFGQTASEPMACGVPVAAFDTSGLKDIVDHKENGYLAKPFDPADLARGIRWILEDSDRLRRLGEAARAKAMRSFSSDVVASQYCALYRSAIEASGAPERTNGAAVAQLAT
jgi:glycosyltransferase involved in cell wall biosynthesis